MKDDECMSETEKLKEFLFDTKNVVGTHCLMIIDAKL